MKRKTNRLFQLEFQAEEEMLLRAFLAQNEISKTTLTAIKYEGGQIFVNDEVRNVRHVLQRGDRITVQFPPERISDGLKPEYGKISIIYEDEAILLLDKPAGQSTIPSRNHPAGTLANYVCGKFKIDGVLSTAHMVTRLDTDTSGVICVAKNRHIHHLLNKQMSQQLFRRSYTAFAEGVGIPSFLTIEQPIGRKDGSIIERTVRPDGQYAKTDVHLLGNYVNESFPFSAVELTLHTGRTHQIRVHMQWAGHPLIGDDLYGAVHHSFPRQALHCSSISFLHPLTKERMKFESALPDDMQRFLQHSESTQL